MADVLHDLWVEAGRPVTSPFDVLVQNAVLVVAVVVIIVAAVTILVMLRSRNVRKRRKHGRHRMKK